MPSTSKATTLYSSNSSAYTLTAAITENSTSLENNTSNITCVASLTAGSYYWSTSYYSTLTIYWHDNRENYDRQVASVSFAGISPNETKSARGQIDVTHKDDGTLDGYAYAYFSKGSTTSSWCPNNGGIATNWIALTTIARASVPTISPSTFNIGDTITITTNRKSTLFTHNVIFYFGNYSYTIATGVTDSVTFDTSIVANQMYQQIPNAAQGQGNVTLETYNGSTHVGTKYSTFIAKVTNSNPTFDVEYADTKPSTLAITQDNQLIIRNNSLLEIRASNAAAKNYATISSARVVLNGVTYNQTFNRNVAIFNIGTLNLSSNVQAQVSVIDSRGITTTKPITIEILDWQLPTAIISLQRHNNFYSETDINVNADYSSLDNLNSITIKTRYKKVSDSTYGSYVTLQDNITSILNLDNNYQWDVQVLVQDRIGSTTYNLTLSRGMPIVYFDKLKSSTSFNCFPQDNESVEINGENILTRILGYGQIANNVSGDWNNACGNASGFYMGNGLTNSPPGTSVAGWWWVIHLVHNENYKRQIAYSFLNNNQIFTRIQNNGTWNNWSLIGSGTTSTDLWVNPNPKTSFNTQDITLSSDDYDYLEVYFYDLSDNNNLNMKCTKILKGENATLDNVLYNSSNEFYFSTRYLRYNTDTSYTIQNTKSSYNGQVVDGLNFVCIPVKIVGIKQY